MSMLSIVVAGVFLAPSVTPQQADQPAPSQAPSALDADSGRADPEKGLPLNLLLEGQVEMSEVRQKIVNSKNNLGLARQDLEEGVRISDTSAAALLKGTIEIPIDFPTRIRLFGAGGAERFGSHVTVGPENVALGNPAGTTETDFDFGLAPVWMAGAEFRLGLGDAPIYLAASFDARGSGDSEEDDITKESGHYLRYRAGLFAGWTVAPGIRPYVGAHYSHFRGRIKLMDKPTGSEIQLDTADHIPLDAAAGIELSSKPLVGGIEIDFVGRLTVMVSAGVRF